MGGLEVRKCVGKLMTLRSQLKNKSKAEAVRATTQRLITDLEMNSTYRGAVEITNLCRHLHPHDTLFAECVRTFGSQSLEGWSWLKRMENIFKKEKAHGPIAQTYIPPTKKPNKRSAWSAPPFMDVYGLRPQRSPWLLLSPYEFFRYWKVEGVMEPSYYATGKARSVWTTAGDELRRSKKYKDNDAMLIPGTHYHVLEPLGASDYFTFPADPTEVYRMFRHTWVLVRKKRPDVVVIEGKRPSASRTMKENAKYVSLFFPTMDLISGERNRSQSCLFGLCPGAGTGVI